MVLQCVVTRATGTAYWPAPGQLLPRGGHDS